MKNLFKIAFLSLSLAMSATVYANDVAQNDAPKIIVEHVTHVGFAPEEYRGTYHFQILSNGEVREVNNKGVVKALATLEANLITNLQSKIDLIVSDELEQAEGPICYDAPSTAMIVSKSTQESSPIKIQQRIACRTQSAVDAEAQDIARIVGNLMSAIAGLK